MIARNPDPNSTLPYLVRLPLGSRPVVLKTKDTWPRTAKVYCHPADEWPDPATLEIVERVPVASCVRRGVAIDLVLDRGRENRSQFVFTKARGREVVFWQSARTRKQARPNVTVPSARASGHQLDVVVDTRERYAWKFSAQQTKTAKRALPVGDYAVDGADGRPAAVVERKSLEDLVSTITGGKLWTLLRLGFDPARLVGNELLPERVAAARQRLPAATRLLEGDATQLALPDGSFDLVVASTVFSSILTGEKAGAGSSKYMTLTMRR